MNTVLTFGQLPLLYNLNILEETLTGPKLTLLSLLQNDLDKNTGNKSF